MFNMVATGNDVASVLEKKEMQVLQLNHKKRFGYFITESFVLPHNQSTETL